MAYKRHVIFKYKIFKFGGGVLGKGAEKIIFKINVKVYA